MRRLALLVLLLVLAGCGGDSVGFYDDDAKELAKREATAKSRFGNVDKFTVESVKERRDCPQAPSPNAGPCLDVVLKSRFTARSVPGTHSSADGAKVETSIDAFIWLARAGARWKVTHKTYRPRSVAVDGVPYSPSN
jgi:hypothetical protein